jgi:beta-galactosidase
VFEHQLSRGLDKLCGAKQDTVSFGPDMWHSLELSSAYGRLGGGVYRQSYLPTTGSICAHYDDEKIAAIENSYGKGKVRIIGTMAGYGYKLNPNPEYLRFFASAIPFAGQVQLIRADYNTGLIPRIWADQNHVFLWCINTRQYPQNVILYLDNGVLHVNGTETLRGTDAVLQNGFLNFEIPGRDASVFALK